MKIKTKKIVLILLATVMVLSFAACAAGNGTEENSGNVESSQSNTEESTPKSTTDNSSAETKDSKILVAYFSMTNNTEGVAKKIADSLGADLYEIMAEQPYTDEDLNYNNTQSRSTIELNDQSARPAISGSVSNMASYNTVVIGYPIWYGQAPKIIYTFIESYDFSGKTILPFCTSHSSGIGSSADNLHPLAPNANWIDGKRFSGDANESEIREWLESQSLAEIR